VHGAPGQVDSVPLTLAPAANDDGDELPNLLEYILGSNPLDANSTATPTAILQPGPTPDSAVVTFEFPRNLAADGYVMAIETSTDLLTWRLDQSGLTFVGTRPISSGRQIETWSTAIPATATTVPLFFRLSAQPR
jgi:hypothetical protein